MTTDLSSRKNYLTISEGKKPFRTFVRRADRFTHYGASRLQNRVDYQYNIYGSPTVILDRKLLGWKDDLYTQIEYRPNLDAYIVDRPARRRVRGGNNAGSPLLRETRYFYDGNDKYTKAASVGNLTKTLEWTGCGYRDTGRGAYDDHGNITSATDAKDNSTTFKYDPNFKLFQTEVRNPKGHIATTVWDTSCQAPLETTDPNGLKTSITYDVHCRTSKLTTPAGSETTTFYQNLGTASQHIKTESTQDSRGKHVTWTYFDGFGQVYDTARTGTSGASADRIRQGMSYDLRGNLVRATIPYIAASPQNGVAGTTTRYDSWDGPVEVVFPDGARATTAYAVETYDGQLRPRIETRNEDCFDPETAQTGPTVCQETRAILDAEGQVIRSSMNATPGGASWKHTTFTYDGVDCG